jgi:rubredoxin
MFVINDNIKIIDQFKFECSHCGIVFDIPDVNRVCPNTKCNVELFERMSKSSFKDLFKKSLLALGISEEGITKFLKGDIKLNSLGLCNELTTIVDRNFESKFGGQFKSFLVKENFTYIKEYNFNGD